MNSPVSYMGNDPIRDQLREWATRGRFFRDEEEDYELPNHENTPRAEVKEIDFSNLEVEGGFDF